MAKTFDPQCWELADYFMSDSPKKFTLQDRNDLAAHIQQCIEDWLQNEFAE